MTSEGGLSQQVESVREVRRNLEASVLPLATSVDGRRFSFQASLHGLELQAGGYVVLEGNGTSRVGQVLTLELGRRVAGELGLPTDAANTPAARTQVEVRYARGYGAIMEGDRAPFHDALVQSASADEVGAWLQRNAPRRALLRLGELALVAGVPCSADAGGFDRHTFRCGQSGSGKTYSLGVILERLLIETDLRLVVLDPNSDFVRLGQVRPGADPALAERYEAAARGVAVYAIERPTSSVPMGDPGRRLQMATAQPTATDRTTTASSPTATAGSRRATVQVPHLSVAERVARGKAARAEVPRSSHAAFVPAAHRPRSGGVA